MNNRVEARGETSGRINTSSVPVEEIIANEGTCTVYGCQICPATTRPILYTTRMYCAIITIQVMQHNISYSGTHTMSLKLAVNTQQSIYRKYFGILIIRHPY